jgi:hypothetical protein
MGGGLREDVMQFSFFPLFFSLVQDFAKMQPQKN